MHCKHFLLTCLLHIVLSQTIINDECSRKLLQSALLNAPRLCIWLATKKPEIERLKRFSLQNPCELQRKTLVSVQDEYLFYPVKFLTVNQTITVGGYFTIPDLLWNNTD